MAPKSKDGDVLVAFSGKWITWAHTIAAYGEFCYSYSYSYSIVLYCAAYSLS